MLRLLLLLLAPPLRRLTSSVPLTPPFSIPPQMDPKFLRNLRFAKKSNKKNVAAKA